jgi:PAS domain-containing protein
MKFHFDKLLLDESPDAVIATTEEGNNLYWSEGVLSITTDEAVGRSWLQFNHPPKL